MRFLLFDSHFIKQIGIMILMSSCNDSSSICRLNPRLYKISFALSSLTNIPPGRGESCFGLALHLIRGGSASHLCAGLVLQISNARKKNKMTWSRLCRICKLEVITSLKRRCLYDHYPPILRMNLFILSLNR